MKTSAIIRIIVWTIVALLLVAILLTGILGNFGRISLFNWNRGWGFDYPVEYSFGDGV